MVNRI